ncbi:tRNA N(3)-methylcytidine methyltransferase METTL6-like [Salvia splendens]|uniref:tRNA N(3)-methylcytidine methyltransferase METTL6-like n=1 Tax=Salvia splendens TaxID=180675 RepID=UPI001C2642DE|nr:tRNA N(3)-methylcytidine methyltransferase METTL6-like [Salvia splendens]
MPSYRLSRVIHIRAGIKKKSSTNAESNLYSSTKKEKTREEVEQNPSYQFHFLPFSKVFTQIEEAQRDSEAWDQFHARHSTGKFFKLFVRLKEAISIAYGLVCRISAELLDYYCFVTLIFTLSALPLDRMPKAIKECFDILKPGGMLLFRDYGICDMTMLRFDPQQRIGYREYLRSDGTRSYFFCLDTVRSLTSAAGFIEVELEYWCINAVNPRKGKTMKRVFVHGKFRKPALN